MDAAPVAKVDVDAVLQRIAMKDVDVDAASSLLVMMVIADAAPLLRVMTADMD